MASQSKKQEDIQMKTSVNIVNSYDNTHELIQKFPVLNPTHVEPGIGEKIQNRLLSGFENWNRGFDAWKAWGNILYTPDSIYNVHGARLTLAEYQAAMNTTLKQVDLIMGAFRNMIICDDWCAIHYDITTVAGGHEIPGSVMEFVNFKDYGGELGTRVVEGWGAPKDGAYKGMAMFRGPVSIEIQEKNEAEVLAYQIPETDDLVVRYPIMHPTTDYSELAAEIREAILTDFDRWNQGDKAWADWADTFYAPGFTGTDGSGKTLDLASYKAAMQAYRAATQEQRLYFDSMLISGDWAAIHYRTVCVNPETGEKEAGDRMQFLRFERTERGVQVNASWAK